ncbi:flagellar basal body-associated protein FliL [Luteitalea pratensis]|uniref:Flagellar protein FliL n=1 Tax=Luteitalea pratensis TaxID=1855912 RepID=A0A143PQN9_LUTPR|nr:flagellar basal body-associated FliL family protein [Luteitalea pratensis]AMY10430.1 flagellar basal body-associated protein FliL [Luteitalea pratensis]
MSKAAKSPDVSARQGKLPLIVGLVVLLGVGGGGGYWWLARQKAAAATETEAGHGEAVSHAEGGKAEGAAAERGTLMALDVFTVNLADAEAQRFLRTNVQLVIDGDQALIKEIEEAKLPVVRVRSAVLDLLSSQKSADIATPEGKDALKKAIAQKAARVLHHEVLDVLFSDFVIQF